MDAVTFEVERGEIFGYLGANGAGKSTTIRMLTGLLAPTLGRGDGRGTRRRRATRSAVKASIGYMSQKFSLYLDLPVRENLLFFGGAYGLAGQALRDRRRRAPRAGPAYASSATRRRARSPAASASGSRSPARSCTSPRSSSSTSRPPAWIPPRAARSGALIRDLARDGTTVFVTTHYLDEAEYCRRIGLMVDGRLVALDTPAALKRTWVPDRVLVARGEELAAAPPRSRAPRGSAAASRRSALGCTCGSTRRAGPVAAVAEALLAGGARAVQVEPAEPSLEDVFLAVVGREGRREDAP